jgi:hypothetical protein
MTVQQWATAAADNNSSPPTGAPEGMAAAAVNNTMREMMASVAIEAQVNRVKVLGGPVAGTNTITGTMTPALTAYSAGMLVVFTPANNNSGAATLNINSLGALDTQKADGDALISGDLVAGIPAVLVLDTGADDWILLNPMTHNVTGLVATGNASIGGTLEVTGALTLNGALTTDNTTADEAGFKGLPLNPQSGNYTCVLADAGGMIRHPNGGGAGDTFTIPAEASVNYPIGTVLTFVNRDSSSVSVAITTDTLTLAGTTSTGTRTLAQNGVATAIKVEGASWMISGSGLS